MPSKFNRMEELNKLLLRINDYLEYREQKDLPPRQFQLWSDWTFSAITKVDSLFDENQKLKRTLQKREAEIVKLERWMLLVGQDPTMAKVVPVSILDKLNNRQKHQAYINPQWLWMHCAETLMGRLERNAFEVAVNHLAKRTNS